MDIKLTTIEALIVSQALGLMILDGNVHPDDRLIAYEVKKKIYKAAEEQLPSNPAVD